MTIKFPDVSHYQSPLSLAGAVVVIAKATEGTSYTDPAYTNFKTQAGTMKAPFMAYHWMNTQDLQAQAQHAFDVVSRTSLMWDAEADGVTVPRLVEITKRYRALGGVVTMLYLPRWFWQSHMGSPSLTPLVDLGLNLISSQYTTYSDTGPGWNPYGGMTPVQWQYTSTQMFNGKPCDFNAFKGTVQQYQALISGAPAPPIPGGNDMANFFHVGDSQYMADSNFERYWVFSGPNANDIFQAVYNAAGRPPSGAVTAAQVSAGYFGELQGIYTPPRAAPVVTCPPCNCECNCADNTPRNFSITFDGQGLATPQ